MDTIGLDLHKRETQLCVLAPDGTAKEQRIVPSRERFTVVLGPLAPATVLREASADSEWVPRFSRYRTWARHRMRRARSSRSTDVRLQVAMLPVWPDASQAVPRHGAKEVKL